GDEPLRPGPPPEAAARLPGRDPDARGRRPRQPGAVDGAGRDLETHPARMQRDVNRSARRQRRAAALLGLALALLPAGAGAQLRPLEAAPWRIFEAGRTVTAGAGMAV